MRKILISEQAHCACGASVELVPRAMTAVPLGSQAHGRDSSGQSWRVTEFVAPEGWQVGAGGSICPDCAEKEKIEQAATATSTRPAERRIDPPKKLDVSGLGPSEPAAKVTGAPEQRAGQPAAPSSFIVPRAPGRLDAIPQGKDHKSISSNTLSAKTSNVSGIVNGAVPPTTATPFLPTKRPSRVDQIQPSAPSARAAVTGNAPIVRQDPAGNATPFEAPRVANSAATTQFVNRPVPTKSVPIERERYARQSITGAANAQPLKKA